MMLLKKIALSACLLGTISIAPRAHAGTDSSSSMVTSTVTDEDGTDVTATLVNIIPTSATEGLVEFKVSDGTICRSETPVDVTGIRLGDVLTGKAKIVPKRYYVFFLFDAVKGTINFTCYPI